jgi:hypothetical protein
MDNKFYTYAWLREDGTPFYIGKGTGKRAFKGGTDRSLKKPPRDRILILKKNLTEEEAFKHEIYMIAVFGRKDRGTGILYNFTDGGPGMRGVVVKEETIRKLSSTQKKRAQERRFWINNGVREKLVVEGTRVRRDQGWVRGRLPCRPETLQKHRTMDKGYAKGLKWFRNPERTDAGMFFPGSEPEGWIPGKKADSEETRNKKRIAATGRKKKPEEIEKMRKSARERWEKKRKVR